MAHDNWDFCTELLMVGYSDADWAGDMGDRKSISGGATISWKSILNRLLFYS